MPSMPKKENPLAERQQTHQEFLDQALERGQTEYVQFLLDCPWVELKKQLTIGEFQFNVSKVLRSKRANRLMTVILSDKGDGKLIPRFVYKSSSNKSWCAATGLEEKEKSYRYKKGKHGATYGYENKLVPELQKVLDELETEPEDIFADIIGRFHSDDIRKSMGDDFSDDTYEKEIENIEMESLRPFLKEGYLPGSLTAEDAGDYFESLDDDFPGSFVPDFKKIPTSVRESDDVTYETYPALLEGSSIEWEMAYNKEGRVWIERIALLPIEVSSYGTQRNVLVVGLLGHKPFDYASQAGGLEKGEYEELSASQKDDPRRIIDITPLLNKLKPIRQFKKQLKFA